MSDVVENTPLHWVVAQIKALLEANESGVPCVVGRNKLAEHHEDRCIVFVPTVGRFETTRGGKQQDADQVAKLLATVPLQVEAHVFGECFNVAWLLWQNVINAARQVLSTNSTNTRVNFPADDPGKSATNLASYCIVHTFEWQLTAWDGFLPLPTDCNVASFKPTKQTQKMLTYDIVNKTI